MIALPTNKDENWRYANLRPLAKARADAVGAAPPLAADRAARAAARLRALGVRRRPLRARSVGARGATPAPRC